MGLAAAGLVLSGIGTVSGIFGQMQQAKAAQASANYQSQVAATNQQIATQNAQYTSAEGSALAAQKEQQTREQVGSILVGEASSGVDVNSPTSKALRTSQTELGQLDAQTIRSNAARKAYGYETDATNFGNQAEAEKSTAANDASSGYFNAATGLLSGAGNAATNYAGAMNKGSGLGDASNYLNASPEEQVAYDVAQG